MYRGRGRQKERDRERVVSDAVYHLDDLIFPPKTLANRSDEQRTAIGLRGDMETKNTSSRQGQSDMFLKFTTTTAVNHINRQSNKPQTMTETQGVAGHPMESSSHRATREAKAAPPRRQSDVTKGQEPQRHRVRAH